MKRIKYYIEYRKGYNFCKHYCTLEEATNLIELNSLTKSKAYCDGFNDFRNKMITILNERKPYEFKIWHAIVYIALLIALAIIARSG